MELANTVTMQSERTFNVPLQILESDYNNEDNLHLQTGAEKFCVSRDGFLLTEALRTAQETPDIRQGKIDALKARIAAGEYEVDPLALATALVREDGMLFV